MGLDNAPEKGVDVIPSGVAVTAAAVRPLLVEAAAGGLARDDPS